MGLGIDNLIVEVDANEPPVADGSARPFAEVLLKSGLVEQDSPRKNSHCHGARRLPL